MPEYDHTIIVECGGEQHPIHVRKAVLEETLPIMPTAKHVVVTTSAHDETTVKAFKAFGAYPPRCMQLAPLIRKALDEYHDKRRTWMWVEWSTEIGMYGLDLQDMDVQEVEREFEKAEKEVAKRTEPMQERLAKLMESYNSPDVSDEEKARIKVTVDDLWDDIERQEQFATDWEDALNYAKRVEEKAAEAEQHAEKAHDKLLAGDFQGALKEAVKAQQAGMRGDNSGHWRKFRDAVMDVTMKAVE
jgi:hypothetical protein